jgi:serine/threonine-protein phosphatase 2A regulatory subunit B''
LSTRIIDRIFSGTVTKKKQKTSNNNYMEEKMSYTEFVWFLMAEEDKRHPRAVEYWFR